MPEKNFVVNGLPLKGRGRFASGAFRSATSEETDVALRNAPEANLVARKDSLRYNYLNRLRSR
jgi:hypothetical protein